MGGGLSAWDGWISASVRRLDGGHDSESGASSVAALPVSSEEMVFGGALYSGGSLHCMDAVRMRCLPAVFAVYGHSSGLQGDARAEGEERRQAKSAR